MASATSPSLATLTLLLLPLDILTLALRFWVRLSKQAWGYDDWAMVVAIPFFITTTVSMVALAWNGLGLRDDQLTPDEMKTGLFWYFMSGTIWTFWVLALKWSIGFTILRIANGKRWVTWTIYLCLGLMTVASLSTGIFQFVQCTPIEAIWNSSILASGQGKCINRAYLANLSTTLAAVSIATDWYMALVPIPLLWNIQMDFRIKLSVIGLLSLGIFASIAGVVRFATIVQSTPAVATGLDYMLVLDPIMTWAQAEPAIATIAANLPALRPLLERILSNLTSITSLPSRHKSSGHGRSGRFSSVNAVGSQYLELDDTRSKLARGKGIIVEKKFETTVSDDASSRDDVDSESQVRIVVGRHGEVV